MIPHDSDICTKRPTGMEGTTGPLHSSIAFRFLFEESVSSCQLSTLYLYGIPICSARCSILLSTASELSFSEYYRIPFLRWRYQTFIESFVSWFFSFGLRCQWLYRAGSFGSSGRLKSLVRPLSSAWVRGINVFQWLMCLTRFVDPGFFIFRTLRSVSTVRNDRLAEIQLGYRTRALSLAFRPLMCARQISLRDDSAAPTDNVWSFEAV